MPTALIILIVVLLVGWLYVRRRQSQVTAPAQDHQASSGSTAYHSVSIRYSPTACRAAMALEGRRFLAASAPHFPLPECDVKKCECRFSHYQDRRTAHERRSAFTPSGHSAATGEVQAERRDTKERREEDDPLA